MIFIFAEIIIKIVICAEEVEVIIVEELITTVLRFLCSVDSSPSDSDTRPSSISCKKYYIDFVHSFLEIFGKIEDSINERILVYDNCIAN